MRFRKSMTKLTGALPTRSSKMIPATVEAFLGRAPDPSPIDTGSPAPLDSASRAIMFTDLQDSTGITARLGDAKAMELLQTHDSLTRKALREHTGREVKHLGDGIMASFASIDQSLECAIAIQRAFAGVLIFRMPAPRCTCGLG